ncbi:MAG: hypothetical protein DRI69_06195 [Bacteroidetes bacterium]|nr:MAG: hypothetical protein DRI69_06195 [Bacteroidota bacterium]
MKLDYETCSREELIEENKALNTRVEHVEFELAQIKRMIFGAKSERFVPEIKEEQLRLKFFKTETEAITPDEAITELIQYERKKAKKKKPSRQPLPDHLERRDTVIEPEGDTTGLKCIGEEITEELEYEEAQLYVNRIIRPKYADPANEDNGIMIAELPSRPIDKGIAGPGLLSRVLFDKYIDHLPLYRQANRFKREKIPLPRSTLGDWVRQCGNLLIPLYEILVEKTLAADYLQVDARLPAGRNPVSGY